MANSATSFVDAIDPHSLATDIAREMPAAMKKNSSLRDLGKQVHEWLHSPIPHHVELRSPPQYSRLPGISPEANDLVAALYLRMLGFLQQPGARDRLFKQLRGGQLIPSKRKNCIDAEFLSDVLAQTSSRATRSPLFSSKLAGGLDDLRALAEELDAENQEEFEELRGDLMARAPRRTGLHRAGKLPPIKGGQTTICSVPSGSRTGDIICTILVIVVILVIIGFAIWG